MIDLILDDCMNVMKDYNDNHFDLAIVDPPYGIERFKKCSEKDVLNSTTVKSLRIAQRFQRMETVNNIKPTKEYFDELFRVSKNQIIWGANNFTLPESEYFIIWDKKQMMPNFARCEYAYVSMGLKKPAKIFEYSIHQHNTTDKIHPTQKPQKLYEWLLHNYAEKGQKILDTHLGSGSIAVACHYFGVDLVGIEIDEEYYNKAKHRVDELTKQETLF